MKRLCALVLFTLFAQSALAQDLRYPFIRTLPYTQNGGGLEDFTMNASTDVLQWVFPAKEAATITTIDYYFTSDLSPPTFKIGIEGVNTSTGGANGTYKTGTGECSATIDTSGFSDETWHTATLTGSTCAVTRGEYIAITIRYASGTIGGSNYSIFGYAMSSLFNDGADKTGPNNAYAATIDGGGALTKSSNVPVILIGNGSRKWGNPWKDGGNVGFCSDSSPDDEFALRFVNPCPTGQTYKVAAVGWLGQNAAANKTVLVRILSTGGTTLSTVTVRGSYNQASAGSDRYNQAWFTDSTLPSLDCGTAYRLSFAPQESSCNFSMYYYNFENNDQLDALPWGKNTYSSHRIDSGSWADNDKQRWAIDFYFDDFSDLPSGGASSGSQLNAGIN